MVAGKTEASANVHSLECPSVVELKHQGTISQSVHS